MNVLVIEDDPVIRKSIVQGLTEAGHDCESARDGEKAIDEILLHPPDVIILDLMLPGRPGLEVLQTVRAKGVTVPVIVLTALGSVEDRVTGLQKGADDYVVKPFAISELLARIEAVSRRSQSRPAMHLTVGDVELDLTTRRARRGDRDIDLTPTEFSVLEMLMRYAGQVTSRQMLCEHVWGFTWEGNTNVIEVHVNRLRNKIDNGSETSFIQTIRGRGYAVRAS